MRVTFPLLVALIAVFLPAAASAHPLGPAAAAKSCKPGFKAIRVAGVLTCRKAKAAAATTTTNAVVVGLGAVRSNPVPLGKPGALGNGWTLTVTSVNSDATSAILAADPGNSAPLNGMQYVLVAVSATYNGPGSAHLTPATSFHAIGASNVGHTSANSFCGKLPSPDLDLDNPIVYKGHTIAGYAACWMVPTADVPSLELYYQPLLVPAQVWFALH
jgi:hypothetical protein